MPPRRKRTLWDRITRRQVLGVVKTPKPVQREEPCNCVVASHGHEPWDCNRRPGCRYYSDETAGPGEEP